MNRPVPRAELEKFTAALAEKRRRLAKAEHSTRGYRDEEGVWRGGLLSFVRYFWHVLEPGTPFVSGWPLEAIAEHLESVTFGEITNLLITVFPGAMKSMLTDVFWPAWEAGPMNMPHIRYVAFSYSSTLTERDNLKYRDLLASAEYKLMYPNVVLRQEGARKVSNTAHGWKLASSVGGVGTGERGDRIICFPFEQVVQTERGPLPIGEIVGRRIDIRVPSLNTKTGEVSMQPVIGWHQNPGSEMVRINLSDGSFVRCTPNHRIWDGVGWVEAVNLSPGAALPVIVQPNPIRNIAPCTTDADTLYCHSFDAITSRQNQGTIGGVKSYFLDLFFSENRESSRTQKSSMLEGIIDVILSSAVLKIVRKWVHAVSIFVTDLMPNDTRANEGFRYQSMDEAVKCFPIFAEGYARVSFHDGPSHYFPWYGQNVSVAQFNGLSFSSRPDGRSGNASYPAKIGDLVDGLQANNGSPYLVIESVVSDGHADHSYCLTVERNHTFVVGSSKGLIVSNCDDGHNIKESESETVRTETVRWFRESMSSRLNNMETGAKIVIMQRVNEDDIAGNILSLGLPYCHLSIEMEYVWQADENGDPYSTSIGWVDPRWRPTAEECDGELAWPERFPEEVVQRIKKEVGPYGFAAQYQQTPEARGGGMLKREWWQPAEPVMTNGKYPPLSYVVASLDGAYTEKEENDPSALTIWGIFTNENGYNRAILLHAWEKRLAFSGPRIDIRPGEHESQYKLRAMPHWGLVEWVADTCNRYKADRLLIEAKASGISAAQSLRNSHGRAGWSIVLVDPKGDKVARAMSIVPSFSQEMIYAPDREWAQKVIDQAAVFPYGKHDDLVDSVTMAIKHLRDSNLLRSDEDRMAEEREAVTHKGAPRKAAYPGFRPMRRA